MRRIFLPALRVGDQPLPADQAHHLRDVLRLAAGGTVEAFDRSGNHGVGELISVDSDAVLLRIKEVQPASYVSSVRLTIAAAIPKAARADWMIEKLSELGTDIFIPLITQRSVVVPQGKGKMDRWRRLAEESAKQSGRQGVMGIEPVTPLAEILKHRKDLDEEHWVLSIDDGAASIVTGVAALPAKLTVLIGPEGGWSPEELAQFAAAGIHSKRLTDTILRVETAAVAVAAIVKLSR